jgi:hypothetical protein
LVNETKRQVEDSWNWDALATSVSFNTVASTTNYTVTGSGRRQKDVVVNSTSTSAKNKLINVPIQWIDDQRDMTDTVPTGIPAYYAWNGFDGTDSKMEIYPTPDGAYTLKVYMYVPQDSLSAGSDTLTVPSEPVILGAYARALVERGEDQGLTSSEAYGLYKSSLADHIALEATRFVENDRWVAV